MEEKLEAFELGEAGPVVPQTLLLLQFPSPRGTQFLKQDFSVITFGPQLQLAPEQVG